MDPYWIWFEEHDLGPTERLTFLALRELSVGNGSGTLLSQSVISRLTGLRTETVSRSVSRLVAASMVETVRSRNHHLEYKINPKISTRPPSRKHTPPAGTVQASLPGLPGGGSRPSKPSVDEPKNKQARQLWMDHETELQELADSHADLWGRRHVSIVGLHTPHLNRIARVLAGKGRQACEDMQVGHRKMCDDIKWSQWPRAYPWVLKPRPMTAVLDEMWAELYRAEGERLRLETQTHWRPGYGPGN